MRPARPEEGAALLTVSNAIAGMSTAITAEPDADGAEAEAHRLRARREIERCLRHGPIPPLRTGVALHPPSWP